MSNKELVWREEYGDEPIKKVILNALVNMGTAYNDEKGVYAGHVLMINNPGLMDCVLIVTDNYLEQPDRPFTRIRVLYLAYKGDGPVFVGVITDGKFSIHTNFPGYWMNAIQRANREYNE